MKVEKLVDFENILYYLQQPHSRLQPPDLQPDNKVQPNKLQQKQLVRIAEGIYLFFF